MDNMSVHAPSPFSVMLPTVAPKDFELDLPTSNEEPEVNDIYRFVFGENDFKFNSDLSISDDEFPQVPPSVLSSSDNGNTMCSELAISDDELAQNETPILSSPSMDFQELDMNLGLDLNSETLPVSETESPVEENSNDCDLNLDDWLSEPQEPSIPLPMSATHVPFKYHARSSRRRGFSQTLDSAVPCQQSVRSVPSDSRICTPAANSVTTKQEPRVFPQQSHFKSGGNSYDLPKQEPQLIPHIVYQKQNPHVVPKQYSRYSPQQSLPVTQKQSLRVDSERSPVVIRKRSPHSSPSKHAQRASYADKRLHKTAKFNARSREAKEDKSKKLCALSEYLSSSSHARMYANHTHKTPLYGTVNEKGQRVLPLHLQPKSRSRGEFQPRSRRSPATRVGRSDQDRTQENQKERERRKELREQITKVAEMVPIAYRQLSNPQKECRLDSLQCIEKYITHIYRLFMWDTELDKLDSDLCALPLTA